MSSKLSATMLDALKQIAATPFVRWPGGYWQRPEAEARKQPYSDHKIPDGDVGTHTIVALWRRKLIELDGPPNGHGSNGTKATITHEGRIAASVPAQPLTPVEEGVSSGSGWMPIESAPRDATILIAVERANGLPMQPGSQYMVYPAYVDDDGRFCNSGDWKPSAGFSGHFRPTHWMPLPPAPGESPLPVSTDKARIAELEEGLRGAVQHTAILKRDAQDRLDDRHVFDLGRIHGMLEDLLNKGGEADA